MKTTRDFEEQVLRKRPYIDLAQCAEVLATPLRRMVQDDGRVRHWGRVVDGRDGTARVLRASNSKRASGGFFRWGIPKSAET